VLYTRIALTNPLAAMLSPSCRANQQAAAREKIATPATRAIVEVIMESVNEPNRSVKSRWKEGLLIYS